MKAIENSTVKIEELDFIRTMSGAERATTMMKNAAV